jgi:DNA-binding MarR family transcriptional regulator
MKKSKSAKQLEKHFKGIANHWRIQILFLIDKKEGISVDEIATELKANMKTISEHTKKLVQAGLVDKWYKGRSVCHKLSPYGKQFIAFINSL